MNFYIHSAGRLERDNDSLVYVTKTDDRRIHIPSKTVKAIHLFGQTEFNTSTLWLLSREKIPCHIYSWSGNHVSTITPHPQQVSGTLAIRQAIASRRKGVRMEICRAIIEAATHNILHNTVKNDLPNSDRIRDARKLIGGTTTPAELMGVEGTVRKLYYEGWAPWLGLSSPFRREYNPPDTPINSILSFLNSLLYATVVSEMYRTALHPGISFLHEPQSRRYSLALDLSEISKPVIVDRTVSSLWNNREIRDTDFEPHSNGVILKSEARKKITTKWDEVINRTSYSAELKRNIFFRGLIRRDCYQLIRFLLENKPMEFYRIKH